MIKRWLLPVVIALTFLAGCGKTDYQSMFAFWTVVSAESGGQPAEDEAIKQDVLIDSEVLTNGEGAIDFRWTDPPRHHFKLDPGKTPKQIDVFKSPGVQEYVVTRGSSDNWPGIYELQGDDLKICLDLDGKARPTEFKTTAGDHCLLLVLKRKKM